MVSKAKTFRNLPRDPENAIYSDGHLTNRSCKVLDTLLTTVVLTFHEMFNPAIFVMCVWMRIQLPFPPYTVKIPLLMRDPELNDLVEKHEEVSFVLPSTIISAIFARGPAVCNPCFFDDGPESAPAFWHSEDKQFTDRLGGADSLSHTLPIYFHEDGVPRWKGESGTFLSWSTPLTRGGSWTTRKCIVGLTSSSMSQATRHAILDIVSWDMQACRAGYFPHTDHTGRPFGPNTAEGKRAGQPIAQVPGGPLWKATFANWKGDQEAAALAHDPDCCSTTFLCFPCPTTSVLGI